VRSSLSTLVAIGTLFLAAKAAAQPLGEATPPLPETRYVKAQLQRIMLVPESVEFGHTVQIGPCDGMIYVTALLRQRDHFGRIGPFTQFVVAVTHPKAMFYDPGFVLTYYEADGIGLVDDARRTAYTRCGGVSPIPPLGLKQVS
jgi:hypothetical protein